MIQLAGFQIELVSEAAELFLRERIGAVASRSIASGRKGAEIAGSMARFPPPPVVDTLHLAFIKVPSLTQEQRRV
jgi:hypothetical protein